MRKQTGGKSSTDKAKARRKLADLKPRQMRAGEAASIKGGESTDSKHPGRRA